MTGEGYLLYVWLFHGERQMNFVVIDVFVW